MTEAEKAAYEKFRQEIGESFAKEAYVEITIRAAFLAGYRAARSGMAPLPLLSGYYQPID